MPRLAFRFVPALFFLLLPGFSLRADFDPGLISAADLLKIKQLAAPAISPDGQWVAYTVKSIVGLPGQPDAYAYRTQLWLARLDGGAPPRQLTHGDLDVSSPAWSPRGGRLAFAGMVNGKSQIWILTLASGETFPVTDIPQGAADPRWSPDGREILFTSVLTFADVRAELEQEKKNAAPPWPGERPGRKPNDTANWAEPPDANAQRPAAATGGTLTEAREWLARNAAAGNPRVFTRLQFTGETALQPREEFTHLYVTEPGAGARPRELTPGYFSYDHAEWTHDGKHIVFTGPGNPAANPDRDLITDLYVIGADGSHLRPLLKLPGYSLDEPRPSPDGRWLAFTARPAKNPADFSYGQTVVGVLDDRDKPHLLTARLDRTAGNLRWSGDNFIYFTAASNGGFPLYRVPPEKGGVARLTGFDTGIDSYDVRGAALAFVLTKPADPYELYASGLDAQNPLILTIHNSEWLADKRLSYPEHHVFKRPGGFAIDAWIMRPVDFDPARKYPLLLEIHGGPQIMWGPGEDTMWHELQFFAAHGYVVVYCNPRGSGGYGYRFQRANYQDWAAGPAGDVLAAADLAAEQPWVDRAREVVTGGSYGGYLTAWLVTQDHRFKAAIAQRGVYDLTTFFGEGRAWQLVPRDFGGYPWEPKTRALLEANSPFTRVNAITTPLLIIAADHDRNVGPAQSEMLYRALKVLGRPVEYIRYPHASHELSRDGDPAQRLDRIVRMQEFFERFVGPTGEAN